MTAKASQIFLFIHDPIEKKMCEKNHNFIPQNNQIKFCIFGKPLVELKNWRQSFKMRPNLVFKYVQLKNELQFENIKLNFKPAR